MTDGISELDKLINKGCNEAKDALVKVESDADATKAMKEQAQKVVDAACSGADQEWIQITGGSLIW